MNKLRMERLYKERRLNNYMLKTIDDLFFIHAVKFGQIEGFNSLNDEDKAKFKDEVIKFFNSRDLGHRNITPLKVLQVTDSEKAKVNAINKLQLEYIEDGKSNYLDM